MNIIIFLLMQKILNIKLLLIAYFCVFQNCQTYIFLISSVALTFHYETEL